MIQGKLRNFDGQFCELPAGQLVIYASHGGNLVNHDPHVQGSEQVMSTSK